MATFRYCALDLQGHVTTGVIEADSPRQARMTLKSRGLFVRTLDAGSGRAGVVGKAQPRISRARLVMLTRQWATLLDAGLPLERTLAALTEQSGDMAERDILSGIRGEILAGHPLHQGLARFGSTFGPLYQALIEAGEQSGQLARVMRRLADNLENGHALRQKVIQALIYPLLIVGVAVLVITGLMTYVVPQVVSVFESNRQHLPLLTRLLIGTSDFLRQVWPLLLLSLAGVVILIRRAWRVEAMRQRGQLALLRVPGLGALLIRLDCVRFARTLSILVNSGIPLLTALRAGVAVIWLLPLQKGIEQAALQVREGMSLSQALAGCPLVPPLMRHMIASGEASGQLGALLEKTASQQESEVSNQLAITVSLLEPLLVLGMGGTVLLIVLAILQPVIEINQLVH